MTIGEIEFLVEFNLAAAPLLFYIWREISLRDPNFVKYCGNLIWQLVNKRISVFK